MRPARRDSSSDLRAGTRVAGGARPVLPAVPHPSIATVTTGDRARRNRGSPWVAGELSADHPRLAASLFDVHLEGLPGTSAIRRRVVSGCATTAARLPCAGPRP